MRAAAAVTRIFERVASRSSSGRARPVPQHPFLWVGLGISFVGLILALWSFTGDRAYDIGFVGSAAVGFALMVVGVFVAAWGRSIGNRRRRAAARRPKGLKDLDVAPLATASLAVPSRPFVERLREVVRRVLPRRVAVEDAPLERATLRCPACAAVFEVEGRRPFDATCRACGLVARVEAGVAPPPGVLERAHVRCPSCAHDFVAEGRRPFDATCPACSLVATVDRGSATEALTLKCPACSAVFDAEGRRPFDAVCPSCSHAARVS